MEGGLDLFEVVHQAVESAMGKRISKHEDLDVETPLDEYLPKTSKMNGELSLDTDPSKGDQKAGKFMEESSMENDLSKTAPQNGKCYLDLETSKNVQEAIKHIEESSMKKDTTKIAEKNRRSTVDMDISKTVQQNEESLQFTDLSKTEQQGEENILDKSSEVEVKSTKTLLKMHSKEYLPEEVLDFCDGQKPSPTALVTKAVTPSKVKSRNTLEKTESREGFPDDRLDSGDGHRPSPTPCGLSDTSLS